MYVFNEKWNISVISEQIRQNWSCKWTVNESAFRSIGYPYWVTMEKAIAYVQQYENFFNSFNAFIVYLKLK